MQNHESRLNIERVEKVHFSFGYPERLIAKTPACHLLLLALPIAYFNEIR